MTQQTHWSEDYPAAGRRFADLGQLELENGQHLPQVTLAYETYGTLNETGSNAILVLHALTGDAHVAGPTAPGQITPGWFDALVGPGKAIDTDRFFVLAPNVLGGCSGSTGPTSPHPAGKPWGGRFPQLTTRDQVRAEISLAKHLEIDRFALVLGASMGGQRALEWALEDPARVGALAVIASGAAVTADQAAWIHTQLQAIELDPNWQGGNYLESGCAPTAGLALARQIAHTTYRTDRELQARFAASPQGNEDPLRGGRLAVQSYLDYHGDKLTNRFDAASYYRLSQTMLTHDVGRARGGVETALSQILCPTLVVGVDSDRLFPASDAQDLATTIPLGFYREVESLYGHDGFLIEAAQLEAILTDFLNLLAGTHCYSCKASNAF
ncbi:MAG: homoserine O-acetyltransferase [Actinomycetaceae bacterium]|nr:homoserine O-acetyltransferase [Actinomycetaceae bacterium]